MKLAIVGSRDYAYRARVLAFVDRLKFDTIVVSGGARGVDTWAEVAAERRGLQTEIYRVTAADWERIGKSAGRRRNAVVVEKADWVVAFWDGASPGTLDTICKARDADKLFGVRINQRWYTAAQFEDLLR